ncbi:unnamed protein product [Nezara viridula]|uniref:Peptidase S1 domain-containing protein n=1 Tax=Nezara viridula TaxID=85310 RepID=A0A9P0HPM8_NEZVI|nr:unnamed protein product [Nezara viridula]
MVRPLASSGRASWSGAPCEGLGGESGTCQLLTECYNPGDFKKEHPPICTFKGLTPVICCPVSTGIREEDFRLKLGYGEPPNLVWKCSGTIITSKFILSAASCAEPGGLGPATWARIGVSQTFRLGKNNNGNTGDDRVIKIVERIAYPDYKDGALYHDIALFQLHKEVFFSMGIGPVCLHNGRLVKGEVTANVWGKSQRNAHNPEMIESKMVLDDNKKCQSITPASTPFPKGVKEQLMFCASVQHYDPNRGPILVRAEGECLATQIGIASYRKDSCGETNYPTIYTKISQYLPWIEGIVFHRLSSLNMILLLIGVIGLTSVSSELLELEEGEKKLSETLYLLVQRFSDFHCKSDVLSRIVGLRINVSKTKEKKMNERCREPLLLMGESVEHFVYRKRSTNEGGSAKDTKCRIQKAKGVF